ncbi:MAG TPA: tyrosine-type recombinase/integrase [Acidimicrobiia bacterium]|nr:tyrosine-type recombinase/integrase [Acidimicrobiia bacterium]
MRLYTEYLFGLGLAPGTVRMYRSMMQRARDWADIEGVDLTDPRPSDLVALRGEFVESAATLRQVRCALVHYWDMMEVTQPPVKALRVPRKPTPHWRGLEVDVATVLAHEALNWHPEGTAVLIGLFTGLRRAEIASMRWDRFTPSLDWYTVTGKGDYTDTIPIHPDLRAVLEEHRGGFVYLFPGEGRRHVNPATVWAWVRTVSEAAGMERISTHQLRHTSIAAVCDLLGIRVAQAFARHRRIDTTQIYTRVTNEQLLRAMEALPWLKRNDPPTAAAA